MNVHNEALLAHFRTPGECECCGKYCQMRCAAHILSVGAGRVDHPLNLVKLGMRSVFDCDCHVRSHNGPSPSRLDFLRIVSARECMPLELIEPIIHAVRACPRFHTFAASFGWLDEHFPIEVATPAIEIIRRNYDYAK